MTTGVLLAGASRVDITPRPGVPMIGYFNRPSAAQGIHDPLMARALVLDNGTEQVALVSLELLWLPTSHVMAIRHEAAAHCPLAPERIFVFCTHTHGGPAFDAAEYWDFPLAARIGEAVAQAYQRREPALLGAGFGMLFGSSINRRWLNRPADPSIGVLRVDRADGSPLALVSSFACHAVVMGYDNLLITGDYPGYSSRALEKVLGGGAVALFAQGGAGDVNPLTETVRQRLSAGYPVIAIGGVSSYYGYAPDAPESWNIEDRGGGQFLECETIARACNNEVLRVWSAITPQREIELWHERVSVDASVDVGEPPARGLPDALRSLLDDDIHAGLSLEISLMRVGSALLLGIPGEVFSETAVAFRRTAQAMGYAHPWLISYANGAFGYLPPADAFAEGGYEVDWALGLGISQHTQARIATAIAPLLTAHAPRRG